MKLSKILPKMNKYNTEYICNWVCKIKAGDEVLLSGEVYTARDAAHKKMKALVDMGMPLPFEINGAVIYYVGSTPAREGTVIGSCGPTTSSRMDIYTPELLDMGLKATIGKGNRSDAVIKSMIKNKAVYFCAIGGAGAIAAKAVVENKVIAFDELGCESIRRFVFDNIHLIVAIDSLGNSMYKV